MEETVINPQDVIEELLAWGLLLTIVIALIVAPAIHRSIKSDLKPKTGTGTQFEHKPTKNLSNTKTH